MTHKGSRYGAPQPHRSGQGRRFFGLVALLAVAGFVAVLGLAGPTPVGVANADSGGAGAALNGTSEAAQVISSSDGYTISVTQDGYSAKPKPVAAATRSAAASAVPLPNVVPDPGSAQAVAAGEVSARGWDSGQFSCLVALWSRESGWRVNAHNPNGAYGIPQALPGSKMATAGADWQTNPATQIAWGLGYISGRYGTPCGAWNHSQSSGWY